MDCRKDYTMNIDGRETGAKELLIKLRDIFAQHCNREVSLEVLLRTRRDAKRAKAYVAMCGLRAAIEEKEGFCLLKISGTSCKCGF